MAEILQRKRRFYMLNRDAIRDCVFPGETVDYSHEQNELASRISYQVAEYLLRADVERDLCFDGRPFSAPEQLEPILDLAATAGTTMKIVKCVAPDDVVLKRLEVDNRNPNLAAAGRNQEKYSRIKRIFQDPPYDFLELDTSADSELVEQRLLTYVDSSNTGFRPS